MNTNEKPKTGEVAILIPYMVTSEQRNLPEIRRESYNDQRYIFLNVYAIDITISKYLKQKLRRL